MSLAWASPHTEAGIEAQGDKKIRPLGAGWSCKERPGGHHLLDL